MPDGIFITIEGIDGAGVTTQAENLQEKLETYLPRVNEDAATDGPHTHLTKEPTDGPAGGQIRVALSERLELGPETLALFFATDRRDHVEQEIEPLLEEGYVVIVDRYSLSSYAYQLDGVGDLEWLRQINKKSPSPDLTIFLDVAVETSRRRRERDRLTQELYEREATLERVRTNYHEVIEQLHAEGENIAVVDAEASEEAVRDRVWDHVVELLREEEFVTVEGDH